MGIKGQRKRPRPRFFVLINPDEARGHGTRTGTAFGLRVKVFVLC